MVLDLLNDQGFHGCYTFLYLPIDYKRRVSVGYAFVDLISPELADRFRQHFCGFSKWKGVSGKVCFVSWSTCQGMHAHIERYRNSPVMHQSVEEEFKPMLFENGMRMSCRTCSLVMKPFGHS